MSPKASRRLSLVERVMSRVARVFSCGGHRSTRRISPKESGTGAHGNSKDYIGYYEQIRIPTPPPLKVWSLQEIVDIFERHEELRGHFVLRKKLGSGSFSVVCKATHKLTKETVAIKIISKKDLAKDDLHRIDREMDNLSLIDHPHVVKVFQAIHTPDMAFIVMEYCNGGDLFDKIVNASRISEKEGKEIFRQIVSAVVHLQQIGIHHRDLKPENILLEDGGSVKLIDFNLSVRSKGKFCSTPCGTVDYAAPEIFKCEEYDATYSESWSLGVLLYALLCSEFPFNTQNRLVDMEREVYPVPLFLSDSAVDLISRSLKFNPQQRLSPLEMLSHPWLTKEPCEGGGGEGFVGVTAEEEESLEQKQRHSPSFCTFAILWRKKRLLGEAEFAKWLSRLGKTKRSKFNGSVALQPPRSSGSSNPT